MMSARKSWLAVGIKDEAFFNSVMSHYAGTYGLASGKGDPIEALLHRIKSIEIVNQRLSQPELRASDGTIGTVASMVTYEVSMYSFCDKNTSHGYIKGKQWNSFGNPDTYRWPGKNDKFAWRIREGQILCITRTSHCV